MLEIAQTVGLLTTAIVAVVGLYQASNTNKSTLRALSMSKTIDLCIYFQKRYERIAYVDRKDNDIHADEYYECFWNLQFEQWKYFRLGYINKKIYYYWVHKRKKEYEKNINWKGVEYQKGFDDAMYRLETPEFCKFMRKIFNSDFHNIYLILKKEKKKRTKKIFV